MSILWMSADKRAAMWTTSYPVYRTPVLIWYRYTVKLIILIITNSKDDVIENTFGTQKSRWKTVSFFPCLTYSTSNLNQIAYTW